MNKAMRAMVAMAALVLAPAVSGAQEATDADLEKRLAEAQQRLEAAAREVAELSAEAGSPYVMKILNKGMHGSRRAMLGVNLGGTEANGGVMVNGVSPGGAAAEAGVRVNDVIVAIDGKPVGTGRDLVAAMESVEPGQKVALDLRRDGKPVKLTVVARPMEHVFMAGPVMRDIEIETHRALSDLPAMHGMAMVHAQHWLLKGWSDAELVTVSPALGRYFGADKGVLVARAPKDSTLGLQDGDVIVAVGGREPQNGPHAMRILRSYQPGETVELKILRDRKAQTLRAAVPEQKFEHGPVMHMMPPPPGAPPGPT